MISINRLNNFVVAGITFPFSNYLLNRKHITRNYNKLLQTECYSQDELQALQLKKLKHIIEYSYRWIPYYKNKFKEIGLHPQDINNFSDIKHIPPLSRQDVIDHHKKMVDMRFRSSIPVADQRKGDPGVPISFARFCKHKLVRNTSSGSTGAPTVFYEDGTRSALNWVHELRLKSWYGISPGAREARMVRISTDYMPKSHSMRMRRLLWNQLILPGVNLAEDDYEICLQKILSFRPKVLWGFTSALSGLAEYVLKHEKSLGDYRPDVVIGWAAPVYDHEERAMIKAFKCSVSNIYGTREVGHIAGKCPDGSFHINQENFFVESQRTDGALKNGPGEILVTTLDITPMPFIRFRMGDLGEVRRSQCTCGRSLQMLENLLGRTGEIFINKDGRMISPNFWCRTFMSGKISGAVRRFQVIYTKEKDLRINIEKDKGFSNETETYIKETIAKNFSPDTALQLQYVPKIKPRVSGKYQMVINEAKS